MRAAKVLVTLLIYLEASNVKYSIYEQAVLRIRIRDPVHFWPRDPGWGKN
jgi:hypothetical protein